MTIRVEAIYENGVLKPVGNLPLAEADRVTVTIETAGVNSDNPPSTPRAKRSIEEIQARWGHIPGSFAETIIEERGEY